MKLEIEIDKSEFSRVSIRGEALVSKKGRVYVFEVTSRTRQLTFTKIEKQLVKVFSLRF